MGHHQLDTLDEQILKLIADNARIPFLEVARACKLVSLSWKWRVPAMYQVQPSINAYRNLRIWEY